MQTFPVASKVIQIVTLVNEVQPENVYLIAKKKDTYFAKQLQQSVKLLDICKLLKGFWFLLL